MKIQTSHKDYYDSGMAHGHDDPLVYMRYRQEIKLTEHYPYYTDHRLYRVMAGPLEFESVLIGFCGKAYTALDLKVAWGHHSRPLNDPPRKWCYTPSDVDNFIKANFKADVYAEYVEDQGYVKKSLWKYSYRRRALVAPLAGGPSTDERYSKIFDQYKCPVFTIRTNRKSKAEDQVLVLNDVLKDYDFIRVMDPYQAFQEISMFVGNTAEVSKPIPVMSDNDMRDIKGFDKFSFRKDPSSKKRKAKKA